MPEIPIFAGTSPLHFQQGEVSGSFVKITGEEYYRISHYDQMRPFFMSIVSPADHWLFISSNGALTAGRKNPEHALFPYYTDDKIHDSAELTGSKTIIFLKKGNKRYLWEPFSAIMRGIYPIERNLYKHIYGHKIVFEEKNKALQLSFCYAWETSSKYGFVKRAWIQNMGEKLADLEILDGIQNILPYGVNLDMQTKLSTLVDAYKKNELDKDSGMGIYSLSSILVDKPEPSEALKATSVWSVGLEKARHLLSSTQLNAFRQGQVIHEEVDIRAERGAYFLHANLNLKKEEQKEWYIVSEIDQRITDIMALKDELSKPEDLRDRLKDDINDGTFALAQITAHADARQLTADRLSTSRHYFNVLFNIMRGGIYDEDYLIDIKDLTDFIQSWNVILAEKYRTFFQALAPKTKLEELLQKANQTQNSQLLRLCYEYLPLTFSRRHGDPSRPWNFFSIETRKEDGSKILNFQGNWRDIFQNWEALSLSYPMYIESIICKFVNASTPDGYNPYRITRNGIDWEVIDPADPWSFIGYWGDHQIIYLLKLMELSHKHHPGLLSAFLSTDMFVYAHVPYKIKPYPLILEDPHNTIDYDEKLALQIEELIDRMGADGKLVQNKDGMPYQVNLTEKLLATVLAKLSNFVPEGGIWMNTQRPEWNDANNALVGYGISMVTLCYLRRFMVFCANLFGNTDEKPLQISTELEIFFKSIQKTLLAHQHLLKASISDKDRKQILKGLATAGSNYRTSIYENGFSGEKSQISLSELSAFTHLVIDYLDHSIKANKRSDGLYHSYNLLKNREDEIRVAPLYEMLEGQVAVLSTGFLSGQESIDLLKALKDSKLFREDQYSYLLYPDKNLPRFTEKNLIPHTEIKRSPLLQDLISANDRQIIEKDINGNFHFNGNFRNAEDLKEALNKLRKKRELTPVQESIVLDIFEGVFDHQAFTGRSGTFYGYEGLGCIYWHMVSKLLLAVNETYFRAEELGEDTAVLGKLVEFYYEIRAGLGLNKSPDLYGAFPTDPYSHTPGNAGAQQPGMTGQVKEDIISRMGELGVVIQDGRIHFHPILLRKNEFLTAPQTFTYFGSNGEWEKIKIEADSLAFTYCQLPIIYSLSHEKRIQICFADGSKQSIESLALAAEISESIFQRNHQISKIEVYLQPALS